ncbi:MAG: TrmH family RNA methyltransferase [Acidobacteria bacterium]|nr:TrmH family RNA methyltransferase [Acidobacteriota bacterium]
MPDVPDTRRHHGDTNDHLAFRATRGSAAYDAISALPVAVVLDSIRSLYNVGSFFRTADAVRVDRLWLCGITGTPSNPRLAKTALGAETTQAWSAGEVGDVLQGLRTGGHEIALVETHPRAVDLFDWKPRFPVAVVFGNEVDGVSPAARDQADTFVRLPMLGTKHSVNVATAGGVVLYELLRKYREAWSR